jgi:hypothetical protein
MRFILKMKILAIRAYYKAKKYGTIMDLLFYEIMKIIIKMFKVRKYMSILVYLYNC